jgi:hypothetical protein
MTALVISSDDPDTEALESNPNVQVLELGPAILVPSQSIGNVVTRTNSLLAGHREGLNSLPQRAEREKPQLKPRDAPASKFTSYHHCHQEKQNLFTKLNPPLEQS